MEKCLFENKIYDKEEYEAIVNNLKTDSMRGDEQRYLLSLHPERVKFFTSLDEYDFYVDDIKLISNEQLQSTNVYGVKNGTNEISIKPTLYQLISKIVKNEEIICAMFNDFKFYFNMLEKEEALNKFLKRIEEERNIKQQTEEWLKR